MEIWKDIKGYEGLYQVSNLGNVKSVKRGKYLSQNLDTKGYPTAHLCNGKSQKRFKTHRLVAEAFIPNINNLPCINHKDENKQNNCVDNLEWCSFEYNNNYGNRNSKISKARKAQLQPILQYTKQGKFLREWTSAKEIQQELNIDASCIYRACEGIYKTAGGFVWKYKKEAQ